MRTRFMMWVDYTLESFPDGSFTVRGEWPGEVMGVAKDGNPKQDLNTWTETNKNVSTR